MREVYNKIGKKTGYQTLSYFEDDEIQKCLLYYLDAGLIEIVCKGFADLSNLKNIKNADLQKLYDCTKTKGFVRTVNKAEILPSELSELVYSSILNGDAETDKAPERWLIIKVNATEIDTETMNHICNDIAEKKKYKHELLDYFTYLLETNPNTQQLHQEIAAYLGTDRHQLARIYKTNDGTQVRSKSEVIISNLLSAAGITYEYEKKLYYTEDKWIEPDFTIVLPCGKQIYWEHVGMLGREEYDARWGDKIDIYKKYFPDSMVKTYESGALSRDASELIEKIKQLMVKTNETEI